MKLLDTFKQRESVFLVGLATLICWQVVMNLGIGFTWDSSRYLFYASQFADYGNTNTAPYAPLFAVLLGTLQKIGLSASASIFIVYSIMLSSIFVVLDFFRRQLGTPSPVFLVLITVFLSSEAMFMLLRRALTELGFAGIISITFYGVYRTLESKKISKWLLLGCLLLPLQRFIGIASSNTILFVASLFVSGTMMEKVETYIKNAIVVNTPFVIFALTTYSVQGAFLGIRKENTTDTYGSNLALLAEVLWGHFAIEMLMAFFVTALGLYKLWLTMKREDNASSFTEPVLMGLSGLTILAHFTTQVYSSTSVVINPINPRYVLPVYPLFLIQFMLIIRWVSVNIIERKLQVSAMTFSCLLILGISYNGITTVLNAELGKHPRELGYNYATSINRIVESIQRDLGPKNIVVYEKGKSHLGFSYIEMGLFDTLSPGCNGGKVLLNFGNHNTNQLQMVPDCPNGISSNVHYTIERAIFADDDTTHILVSKLGLAKAKQSEATKNLQALGFALTDKNEHFMLYKPTSK